MTNPEAKRMNQGFYAPVWPSSNSRQLQPIQATGLTR